jgi:hypothetical protein
LARWLGVNERDESRGADIYLQVTGTGRRQVFARQIHDNLALAIFEEGVGFYVHPWASRTLIMASRMVFQVAPVSSMALGNIQPSQQMCLMPRSGASFSQ